MMETVGSYQAKTHLAQLLDRVASGESFVITKHGVPVARLVPLEDKAKPDVKKAIDDLLEFRKQRAGRGFSIQEIKELINEGRRL
jgi:prevent-host-death family protein